MISTGLLPSSDGRDVVFMGYSPVVAMPRVARQRRIHARRRVECRPVRSIAADCEVSVWVFFRAVSLD
jgi:hypothetical protein